MWQVSIKSEICKVKKDNLHLPANNKKHKFDALTVQTTHLRIS